MTTFLEVWLGWFLIGMVLCHELYKGDLWRFKWHIIFVTVFFGPLFAILVKWWDKNVL